MFGPLKISYEEHNFKELFKDARIRFNLWHKEKPTFISSVIENGKMVNSHHAGAIAGDLLATLQQK
jgi:hypothetical protein